ncbi:hypothetical protein D1641_05735 [Colidextribacter sp. OB.20]|uniref:hypothetical protein n=1 Tax=Colidextribacter sp. OB.20 TaxID=2304568 RepID=UPI001371100D|nr:hypothetical protein [Colidextribacter sp. OB.20]NBI09523.1 hypothetical protein [Colidextribacter sp. OB.20]
MLIKQLLTGNGDYGKSLKQRRWAAIAMLCIGLVGFACWFLLVPNSPLSEHAQGFYLGAASGITAGALVLLIRTQYLITHPQAQRKAKIKETDERERKIVHTAFEVAGGVTFFASAAALFVVLPLSMDAFRALLAVMTLFCLAFVTANAWLSKKL